MILSQWMVWISNAGPYLASPGQDLKHAFEGKIYKEFPYSETNTPLLQNTPREFPPEFLMTWVTGALQSAGKYAFWVQTGPGPGMRGYSVHPLRSPQASYLGESRVQCRQDVEWTSWWREENSCKFDFYISAPWTVPRQPAVPDAAVERSRLPVRHTGCTSLPYFIAHEALLMEKSSSDAAGLMCVCVCVLLKLNPRPLLIGESLKLENCSVFSGPKTCLKLPTWLFRPAELHWKEHKSHCWWSQNHFGTPQSWCRRRRKTSQLLRHRICPWTAGNPGAVKDFKWVIRTSKDVFQPGGITVEG